MAVTQNNEQLVTQLLDLGASQATLDLQGKTPVMAACEYGHLQALESLVARGVNMAGEVLNGVGGGSNTDTKVQERGF